MGCGNGWGWTMHRHTKWLHKKGRAYADSRNDQAKEYQSTFAGMMALKAGRVNTSAKMRGAQGRVSAGDLIDLWAHQNGIDMSAAVRCAECGAMTPDWHVDHVVPLKDGGEHNTGNMQLLCEKCHKVKTRQDRDAYVEQPSLFDTKNGAICVKK